MVRRPGWRNWAGNVGGEPSGVQLGLGAGLASVPRWRVLGYGASSSALAVTDGVLVDARGLDRVLVLDEERAEVTVQGGVTMGVLAAWLAERGWILPEAGTTALTTVAGAVATGFHGTGARWGTLSNAVRAMRIVRVDGEEIELRADRPEDAEALAAARVHLGAFGLVTEVTLGVERGAVYALEVAGASLDDVLRAEWRANADHVDCWWFPTTRRVIAVRRTRTQASPTTRSPWPAILRRRLLEDLPLGVVTRLTRWWPRAAMAVLTRFGRGPARPHREVCRWDWAQVGTRSFRAFSAEIAVPEARAAEAVDAVAAIAARHAGRTPIHVPVNLRWTGADTHTLISPAQGRASLWIDVAWSASLPGWGKVLAEIEAALLAFEGRPHWGKLGFRNPSSAWPEFSRWEAQRARFDPERRLVNGHLARLLDGRDLLDAAEAERAWARS